MAIITKITTQKKRSDRYNVYVDKGKGEEYGFSVDEEVLIKFQLKKGKEIDEFDFTDIKFYEDIQKAFTMALHYLSHRMRSETEVRVHLRQKEVEDPIIQEAIHKLYHFQYLNDLEFAKAYVRTQMNSGTKGTSLITMELKEKGISDQDIEEAIQEYPYELQLDNAMKFAEKTVQKNQKTSEREKLQKLEQSLMRKGFPRDIITDVLNGLTTAADENAQWEALCHQAEKARRRYQHFEGLQYEQKMKLALYRKGFHIEQIERYLEQEREGLI
ncbi:recombination regulator RecX [Peribacillus saganii]|uniref:Regulatory protein RecX n=1 Tax=Peribacillus saganii TaxID=2303992 RepID=A0A372LNC7_9BACI|nr:recombination regulator RecX [Peribacillus saganii]RFU68153.1 recombination regulator RecX [Peribacillus saganii]